MRSSSLKEAFAAALILMLFSWGASQAGIYYGQKFVPAGAGLEQAQKITSADLFRFDALLYHSIATEGYSYNSDPYSSPNIVFAPMFPLMVAGLAFIPGLDEISAGFLLNKILFFFALVFLWLILRAEYEPWPAFLVLLAMATCAGAYAFHAFYSESAMLFFLGLCLLSAQRQWWGILAVASAGLGATRLTALPMILIFSGLLVFQIPRLKARAAAGALVCLLGAAAYLGYIAAEYGNPFTLIPEIQTASWGLFHPPVDYGQLLTGGYLFSYWSQAFDRGFAIADIKTLNLLWTTLAGISVIYMIFGFRKHLWTYIFASYFIFIYVTNSSSSYLISAHRFFAMMIPIFLMFAGLHRWLAKKAGRVAAIGVSSALLLINLFYGVLHCGYFNQGSWYYF